METPQASGGQHQSHDIPSGGNPPDTHGVHDGPHSRAEVGSSHSEPGRASLEPTEAFRQELRQNQPAPKPVAHETQSHLLTPADSLPKQPTDSGLQLGQKIGPNGQPIAEVVDPSDVPPPPSGRWQTFWYALSVLSLGILFTSTSVVTSSGTLQKLLLGLQNNPEDVLFGARLDIILANSLLGAFIVCLPLFILSTIKVDRYRQSHVDMPTTSLKKISYIFMVLSVLVMIGQISTAIFQALNYTFSTINIVPVFVDICFVAIYFFWLYTSVAEDRLQ